MDDTGLEIPLDLIEDVAFSFFTGTGAPCSAESVEPLTRMGLLSNAEEFLRVVLPILVRRGWTPPEREE